VRPRLEALEGRTLPSVAVLSAFDGINATQSACNCQPPDPDAAVGPGQLVETVNLSVAFYDKASGRQLFFQKLKNFFAPVKPGAFLTDPVVAYDDGAGRFVLGVLDLDMVNKRTYIEVAVSNSSNPLDGFREMHKIETTETLPDGTKLGNDYPKLGFNADAYVFTVNMKLFDFTTLQHGLILTLDKASVLDRDPATLTLHKVDWSGRIYMMAAATMHGTQPGGPMYFVQEVTRYHGDQIKVVRMTDVLSDTPQFEVFELPVTPYRHPPNAVHDTNGTIQTFESFVLNADWRDNHLVADQHIGAGGVTRVRWYEFDTSTATPTLTQEGDINQGPGVYTYFPAIALASNHDIGLTFMESSATEFVSMYITGRSAGDPLGTMQKPVDVHPGQNKYSGNRGGDYSGLVADPVAPTTFWAAAMYKPTVPFWGTGIAHFQITAGGTAPGDATSPAGLAISALHGDEPPQPSSPPAAAPAAFPPGEAARTDRTDRSLAVPPRLGSWVQRAARPAPLLLVSGAETPLRSPLDGEWY
jgi:hypothetical protein